ncbi:MAG TPA: hypothetical protein DIT64_19190 [Verrucomicrobiales bacterium]|nr:hypothetical protein [Verrucomicrobiales bacterium]
MKTMPDPTQAAPFQETASADDAAHFVNRNLHRVWQTRRMKATLLRPFRKVLRPLLVWIRQEHFHVKSGLRGQPPAGLELRKAGWETLALGLVLGPLVFLMLLPLLILMFPAALLFGLASVAGSALQAGADDAEQHALTWHAAH